MEEREGLLAAARSFAVKSGEDKVAAGQRLQQLVLKITPEAVRATVRALRDDPAVSFCCKPSRALTGCLHLIVGHVHRHAPGRHCWPPPPLPPASSCCQLPLPASQAVALCLPPCNNTHLKA